MKNFKVWACWLLRHNLSERGRYLFTDAIDGGSVYEYHCECGHTYMSNERTWFNLKVYREENEKV